MALDYITSNSTQAPTASQMNELWSAADTVVDKAMDGKSLWFLEHLVGTNDSLNRSLQDKPWRGMQFWVYDSTEHTSGGSKAKTSFIYGMHVHSGVGNLPAEYDESAIDTAVASASTPVTNSTDEWAQSASGTDLFLSKSLKTHTKTISSTAHYLWEHNEPAPDKRHAYAVAEIMVETHSGSYTLADTADKFNFFKIHNLKNASLTFNFGSNYTVTVPALGQVCVRRDSVSSGYDSSYKYFFKANKGDPRWLYFESHDGLATQARVTPQSVACSMRANNVCNASFLHSVVSGLTEAELVSFDQHELLNDITSEYEAAGIIPTIGSSTRIADLVYTKGKLGYIKRSTSGGTQTAGTIDFDGFADLSTALSAHGISVGTSGNNVTLAKNSDYIFLLYGLGTNLLIHKDRYRVLDLGANGDAATIVCEFHKPEARNSNFEPAPYYNPHSTSTPTVLTNSTTTVSQLISAFTFESWVTASSGSVVLTTEGPVYKWSESWDFGPTSTSTFGFVGHHVLVDQTNHKLTMNNFWRLCIHNEQFAGPKYRFYSNGWPSRLFISSNTQSGKDADTFNNNRHHRLFEGPRKARRYEDSGTHLDFTGDPAAAGGADFTQGKFGTFETIAEAKLQSCDFNMKVPAFTAGDTNKANIPRCIPNDPIHDLEANKTDSAWLNSNIAAIRTAYDDSIDSGTGLTKASYGNWSAFNGNNYLRMNLLKEHFNDLARPIKAAKRFAPFNVFDISERADGSTYAGFGGGGTTSTINSLTAANGIMPIDAFSAWNFGATNRAAIEDAWTAVGVPIRDFSDADDDFDDINKSHNGLYTSATALSLRWVKTSDVLTAAANYGFKIRKYQIFVPYVFRKEYDSSTNKGFLGFDFIGTGASWKQATSGSALVGSSYSTYSNATYNQSLGANTTIDSAMVPGNRSSANFNGHEAYYVECIDTSITSDPRATVIWDAVDGGTHRFYQDATVTTFYLTAPQADKKYRVAVKPADVT